MPFVITDSSRTLTISASLAANSQRGGTADISHTASLGLVLPEGLTFTSDSRVFLTEIPSGPDTTPTPHPRTRHLGPHGHWPRRATWLRLAPEAAPGRVASHDRLRRQGWSPVRDDPWP